MAITEPWNKTWDFWNNPIDSATWNPSINIKIYLSGGKMENETIKVKCPECGKEHTVVIIVKEKEVIKEVPYYPYYPYKPWYEKRDTGTDWTWQPQTTTLTDSDGKSDGRGYWMYLNKEPIYFTFTGN